jgi:hypothetical protein
MITFTCSDHRQVVDVPRDALQKNRQFPDFFSPPLYLDAQFTTHHKIDGQVTIFADDRLVQSRKQPSKDVTIDDDQNIRYH